MQLQQNVVNVFIVIGFVLLMFCLLLWSGSVVSTSLPLLALAAIMLMQKPRILLLTYALWGVLAELIEALYPEGILQYVDETLTIAVASFILLTVMLRRQTNDPQLKGFRRLAGACLAWTLVSGLINDVRPVPVIHFIFTYFAFVPVFLLASRHLTPIDVKPIVRVFVAAILLQLVTDVAWLAGVNPLPNPAVLHHDLAIGTFYSNPAVAYFSCFAIFLFLAVYRHAATVTARLLAFIEIGLGFFSLGTTFCFHAYLLLAGAFLIHGLTTMIRRLRLFHLLLATTLPILLVVTFEGFAETIFGGSVTEQLSPYNLERRWNSMVDGIKGRAYVDVIMRAPGEMPHPWLGAGPGNFGSTVGVNYRSLLAQRYITYAQDTYSGRRLMAGGSMTEHNVTGALGIWSELGPIGFLLFFGLHVYAWVRIWLNHHRNRYPLPSQRIAAECFLPCMTFYLFSNLLLDIALYDLFQICIWVLAALAWTPVASPASAPEDLPTRTGDTR